MCFLSCFISTPLFTPQAAFHHLTTDCLINVSTSGYLYRVILYLSNLIHVPPILYFIMSNNFVYICDSVQVAVSLLDVTNRFDYVTSQFTTIRLSLDSKQVSRTLVFRRLFIWHVVWEAEVSSYMSFIESFVIGWLIICRDLFFCTSIYVRLATQLWPCWNISMRSWRWLHAGNLDCWTTIISSKNSPHLHLTSLVTSWHLTEMFRSSTIAGGRKNSMYSDLRYLTGSHWMKSSNSLSPMLGRP